MSPERVARAICACEGMELVRLMMQELFDTGATDHIGAGRYERTESRVPTGTVPTRLIATRAGGLELRIPKLRRGSPNTGLREAPMW